MRAISEIFTGASAETLGARIAGAIERRGKVQAQIAELEAERRAVAADAVDDDRHAGLRRVNVALARRRQLLSDIGVAIESLERQRDDAQERERAAAAGRKCAEQDARLAARLDHARQAETLLRALVPHLKALDVLGDKAAQFYWENGGRGAGADGRGGLPNPLRPNLINKRLGDFLFGLGVPNQLLGAEPMTPNGDKATDRSFAEWEAELQKVYVLTDPPGRRDL